MRQFLIELITQNSRLSFSAFFSIAQSGDKRNRFLWKFAGEFRGVFAEKIAPCLAENAGFFEKKRFFDRLSPREYLQFIKIIKS